MDRVTAEKELFQAARPSSLPMTRGELQGDGQQFVYKDETNEWTRSRLGRRMT